MFLALLLLAAPVQPPKTLAVLEFRSSLPKGEVEVGYLVDVVRTDAKDSVPTLKVMTRENLLVLLQATGKKMEECEGECEVDTGRRVGADFVVSGEVLKFGTQFKVSMRLHETHGGELLSGAQATGKDLDELDKNLHAAVAKLLKPLVPAVQAEAPVQQQPQVRPQPPQEERPRTGGDTVAAPQSVTHPSEPARHGGIEGGLFGTVGVYEPDITGASGSQSYSYGLAAFAAFGTDSGLAFGLYGDYDNFTFDTGGDVTGYGVGGLVRYGGEAGALYGGVGYSTLDRLGGGLGLLLGLDFEIAKPLALRLELGYRTFSSTTTVAAVSTEVSGSLLTLKGGVGIVF